MFLVAAKTAIVKALRDAFDVQFQTDPNLSATNTNRPAPRHITIEYPLKEHDWPFILVQLRPIKIEWTGIMPDETIEASPIDPVSPLRKIRQGYFEATVQLQIMALSSEERDRIWDMCVKLLLMGRKNSATRDFFTSLETQELIGITVQEGTIAPIGDTISIGTPFAEESIAYEASIEFDLVGRFYADEFTESLVAISEVEVSGYIPDAGEAPSGETDGQGSWIDPFE